VAHVIVHLTDDQVLEATRVGMRRVEENLRDGRKDRQGVTSAESHVIGALGECACAKFLSIPWTPLPFEKRGEADLEGEIEVRTARLKSACLPVKKWDKLYRRFVLVTLESFPKRWNVRGWLIGAAAASIVAPETKGRWKDCWMVPVDRLNPAILLLELQGVPRG